MSIACALWLMNAMIASTAAIPNNTPAATDTLGTTG